MDIPANLERSLVVMLQLAFQKQFAPSAHRVENFLRLTYPKLNGFDYSIKTVAAALFALEQLDGSAGNRALECTHEMFGLAPGYQISSHTMPGIAWYQLGQHEYTPNSNAFTC